MHTNFLTILINLFCCRAERCLSLWIHGWLGKKLNDTSLSEKEAAQLENKVNQIEKSKFDVKRLRENHKDFTKNNKINVKITVKI